MKDNIGVQCLRNSWIIRLHFCHIHNHSGDCMFRRCLNNHIYAYPSVLVWIDLLYNWKLFHTLSIHFFVQIDMEDIIDSLPNNYWIYWINVTCSWHLPHNHHGVAEHGIIFLIVIEKLCKALFSLVSTLHNRLIILMMSSCSLLSSGRPPSPASSSEPISIWTCHIFGLWWQKQVSQAGISNCIPQYSVVCNYYSVLI